MSFTALPKACRTAAILEGLVDPTAMRRIRGVAPVVDMLVVLATLLLVLFVIEDASEDGGTEALIVMVTQCCRLTISE